MRERDCLNRSTTSVLRRMTTGECVARYQIAILGRKLSQGPTRIGRCFFTLLCFMVSVLCAAYGLVLYTGAVVLSGPILPLFGSFYWGFLAVAFLLIGIVFVSNTLIQVNHAATNPETLSLFRVSFDTGSTAEGFAVSQNVGVSMIVHN